ncbi:MAG TPA: DNA polymerase III subunit beta [Candidatus Magasanikbacteria bacterium]|nr:DNA polymerase III subunit beta [Candidatus Magasanikbacteria bacterium]
MKFSCTKDNLAQALSLVAGLATKNVNLPILSNVLLRAEAQKVEISSTNLELAIVANVRAIVDEPGIFTVPGRTLLDFVNLMTEEKIDFELKENELSVVCGRSATRIKGSPADEFPVIPSMNEGKGFALSARDFKKGLSEVASSAAKSDIRPELAGVFFGFNVNGDKILTLAATDSYRLAEKKLSLEQSIEEPLKIIVPGRAANEIMHILSAGTGEISEEKNARLLIGDNQIALHYGSVQLVSRLVDGQYPDYPQIIPKDFKTTAEFEVNKFIKEIKAASLFTTAGVNAISVEMNPEKGLINISSTSTQTGEYKSEVESQITGEKNNILLNHRYLLEGLSNMEGQSGEIKMINADSPCLLTSKEDSNYLYIVMPIRQ